jgi:hypothetical protein
MTLTAGITAVVITPPVGTPMEGYCGARNGFVSLRERLGMSQMKSTIDAGMGSLRRLTHWPRRNQKD